MNQVLLEEARKEMEPTMMNNAEITDTAATVAERAAQVAPKRAESTKAGRQKKGTPKGRRATKAAKSTNTGSKQKRPVKNRSLSPNQSKGAMILGMIGRPKGATLAEIMSASGWQAHSVRGFLSTAGGKHDVRIESTRTETGGRLYRMLP